MTLSKLSPITKEFDNKTLTLGYQGSVIQLFKTPKQIVNNTSFFPSDQILDFQQLAQKFCNHINGDEPLASILDHMPLTT